MDNPHHGMMVPAKSFLNGSAIASLLPGVLLVLLTLTGCEEQTNQYIAPPPPKVTVAYPEVRDFVQRFEFTGSLTAVETVELVARVQGFLQSIHFEDGDFIDEGQLLFIIDPKPFEADLEQAKTQVEIHKAEVIRAETEYERNRRMLASAAASESEVVKWKGQLEKAKGEVAAAEAQVALAEINLGYTRVSAPFPGHMSRRQVDIGNLVGGDEDTVLATLTRKDPIYVYFSVSERDVQEIRGIVREEYPERNESREPMYKQVEVPIRLALGNEDVFTHEGKIDYVDPVVNPQTGTLTVRGVLPNPDRALLPGMFARVQLPVGKPDPVLMVPERAFGVDQGGQYVLVVNDSNEVEVRTVSVGARIDSRYVVEEGISGKDRIVVNGIQMARPGAIVTPEMAKSGKPSESGKPAGGKAERESEAGTDARRTGTKGPRGQ